MTGSVEEAFVQMYLAGVSVRRVEDITEAPWGSKVYASTNSKLSKKAYVNIEAWRNRPLAGKYPYIYVAGNSIMGRQEIHEYEAPGSLEQDQAVD